MNKQIRKLLRSAGINPRDFNMGVIKGKPAKTKNKIIINENKVTIFGSDFVCKGYLK